MASRTLVFEIGTEELPAAPLYAATEKLAASAEAALAAARVAHGQVRTCSTPRRIILSVQDVASASEALQSKAKGPAAKIAFGESGNPTKAALGFARGKGVDAADLVVEPDEKGVPYVYAVQHQPAVPTMELLPGILAGLVAGISWPRSQRWGSGQVTFGRPIRWFVALLGEEVVEFEYAGVKAGRVTQGHRLIANRAFEVASAEEFFGTFPEMKVIPSAEERAELIRSQIAAVEERTGLRADTPKATFDEVVNLVEWPTVLVGHFDERFLAVPPEIITDAMLQHQRYFPLQRPDGSLDNAFIIVGNGDPACSDTIREGNERVVRARLADAEFFVAEDERQPLASYLPKLREVIFQEQLGTLMEKAQRIGIVTRVISGRAGLSKEEGMVCMRAAMLCKCDLVTNAVVEFTSLQGVMGGHYALASGESEAVAQAVSEHYHPRFSGDTVPSTTPGKVVALADKLDTICGIFTIGQAPTGSSDPFALRRSALGILSILLSGLDVPLLDLIEVALHAYSDAAYSDGENVEFDFDAVQQQVVDFFVTRTKVMLRDEGCGADAIDAVLAAGVAEPLQLVARVQALEAARTESPELFADLATAHARANNLREPSLGTECDAALFGEAEQALDAAIAASSQAVEQALAASDYAAALAALAGLRAPIDAFFEDVMVMADDEALRANRLKLLNRFVEVFAHVADISKLAAK